MSFTTSHRNGFTTARCDSPRCTAEVQWRGPADSPPVTARNALRGHMCPKWRPGQVAQEGGREVMDDARRITREAAGGGA